MVNTCDTCGRKTSEELWKHSTKSICPYCLQQNLLEKSYAIFSPDAREALKLVTKEIETLLDKRQEQEVLPLLKKGLSYMNGYLVHGMDATLIEDGIYWYNEALKEEGRFDSTRFVVDRTLLVGSVRFVIVLYLVDGKEPETWKYFTGKIPTE